MFPLVRRENFQNNVLNQAPSVFFHIPRNETVVTSFDIMESDLKDSVLKQTTNTGHYMSLQKDHLGTHCCKNANYLRTHCSLKHILSPYKHYKYFSTRQCSNLILCCLLLSDSFIYPMYTQGDSIGKVNTLGSDSIGVRKN